MEIDQIVDVDSVLFRQCHWAARQSGVVVADADEADVLKMVGAIAWAAQGTADSSAQADRLLALFMNGLCHPGVRR